MSKLTGMQIFALLSDVKDGLILESAAPLITAGATAAGTAGTIVLGDTTATASTAAKAGFGAWVAKGGWVALVAAGVAAVGVAVGAFFLGNGGDVPSVGTEDVTVTNTEPNTTEEITSEAPHETESEAESEAHVHAFSDWNTVTEPTCSAQGTKERVCACGFREEETILTTEHVFGEWAVYEPATCYHTGTLYATCTECGKNTRQYDAIEKLPHGFEEGYCTVCGLVEGADGCFAFRFLNDSNAETVAFIHSREGATGERVILPNVAYDDFSKQIVPVVGLDERLFAYDETLREIILPDSLDGISKNAFAYCVNLQNIDLPAHIEVINDMAFYGCTSLTEIVLPDGVTTIYDKAFAGCTGITEITLPDSMLYMGRDVFADCTGLTHVTIPGSIIQLHDGIFNGCSSLSRVNFKGSVSQWNELTLFISLVSPSQSSVSFTVYCDDGEVVVN